MTSLHRKWSPKVAIATNKEDDGGVAACLNWSYGNRLRKQKEFTVSEETVKFQETIDRVLEDLRINKENDMYKNTSPEPELERVAENRSVLSPRENISRLENRPPTPADLEIMKAERTWSRSEQPERLHTTDKDRTVARDNKIERDRTAPRRVDRRPQTPARCSHTRPSERVEAWMDHRDRTSDDINNNKKKPQDSTKKFLKQYFNRPLTDEELRRVLKETHRRISDDIVEAALGEHDDEREQRKRNASRPPALGKSCTLHNRNEYNQRRSGPVRAVAIPRQDHQLQLTNDADRQRPSSAQYASRDNRVTWGTGVRSRPGSATYPARVQNVTSEGKHLSSWRPSSTSAHYPWTQSAGNYDDLWRVANKHKKASTKRYDQPKQLGATRYRNDHYNTERDYLQNRPVSQQGRVNVQLDCPDDRDMMVSVRVHKSQGGMRY